MGKCIEVIDDVSLLPLGFEIVCAWDATSLYNSMKKSFKSCWTVTTITLEKRVLLLLLLKLIFTVLNNDRVYIKTRPWKDDELSFKKKMFIPILIEYCFLKNSNKVAKIVGTNISWLVTLHTRVKVRGQSNFWKGGESNWNR